jgi:hypothetical protein
MQSSGLSMTTRNFVFGLGPTISTFFSRFSMVAISMARNDIRYAVCQAGAANTDDKPEFAYWVRISTGHFFEAANALKHWRQVPEVRGFIAKLPKAAREDLRSVNGSVQKIGPGVLEHSRNRTFHYPYPSSRYPTDAELKEALRALGSNEATVVPEVKGIPA